MVVATGLPVIGSGVVLGTSTTLPSTLTVRVSTGGTGGSVFIAAEAILIVSSIPVIWMPIKGNSSFGRQLPQELCMFSTAQTSFQNGCDLPMVCGKQCTNIQPQTWKRAAAMHAIAA